MTTTDDFKHALNRYEREHYLWSEDPESTNWEECSAARDNLVAIFEEQNTHLRLILETVDQILASASLRHMSVPDCVGIPQVFINRLYNQTDDLIKALRSGNV